MGRSSLPECGSPGRSPLQPKARPDPRPLPPSPPRAPGERAARRLGRASAVPPFPQPKGGVFLALQAVERPTLRALAAQFRRAPPDPARSPPLVFRPTPAKLPARLPDTQIPGYSDPVASRSAGDGWRLRLRSTRAAAYGTGVPPPAQWNLSFDRNPEAVAPAPPPRYCTL